MVKQGRKMDAVMLVSFVLVAVVHVEQKEFVIYSA